MGNIIILQCRNQYGYTIKQLKIDYDNKTYSVGNFSIGADRTVSKKVFNEKIQELELLKFREVK